VVRYAYSTCARAMFERVGTDVRRAGSVDFDLIRPRA
jgi:hypothetical protein